MRIKELPAQKAFLEAISQSDKFIAKHRYCPRKYYQDIQRYYLENDDILRNSPRVQVYWHANAGVHDHNNMHQHYYMNDKGKSFHLSFEVAESLSERNKVMFGSPDVGVRRYFGKEINKLRRLAKAANLEIEQKQNEYDNTPAGILHNADKEISKVRREIRNIIAGRQHRHNYYTVQQSNSSDRSTEIFENRTTGEIGRITYSHGTTAFRDKGPSVPVLTVFFENAEMQEICNKELETVGPHLARMQEVVEEWEAEQIMNRLKGEVTVDADPPW